jgi:hypothetical protein
MSDLLKKHIEEIHRDLRENRLRRRQFDGARSMFHPVTWAQEASVVYHFLPSAEAMGLKNVCQFILRLATEPVQVILSAERLVELMDSIDTRVLSPAYILTYDEILAGKLAPVPPLLMIVDDGKDLLDTFRKVGKDIRHFFRWSVGDYPLPNLHTHLILQSVADEGS